MMIGYILLVLYGDLLYIIGYTQWLVILGFDRKQSAFLSRFL